jgi:hypothetical protein
MKRLPTRAATSGLLLAVLLAAGLVSAAGASAEWHSRAYQNVAIAIPATAGDTAGDLSSKVYRVSSGRVRGSAVATASVICDGCQADAVTMQVLSARAVRTIRVDNVAAAWSSCTGCRGVALSLQVVIARSANQVVANNRSLALNAGCTGCTTVSAAVQLVLISPDNGTLSRHAIDALIALRQQLHAQLLAELATAPTAPGRALAQGRAPGSPDPITATVLAMQSVAAADVHALSGSHDLQLRRG